MDREEHIILSSSLSMILLLHRMAMWLVFVKLHGLGSFWMKHNTSRITQPKLQVHALTLKRRWCLTGTPIQNRIDDLYSYFKFIKLHPVYSYDVFLNNIRQPISENEEEGYKKLQAILDTIMLRRNKGQSSFHET